MSFRPSAKKALKAYGGSRAGRAADQRDMLNKVARAVSAQGLRPPRLSAVSQQALRVGGWASPSRMGELKFKDTDTIATIPLSMAFAGGILLNGLIPGSTATTRIGRKVILKSLLMRYRGITATTSVGGCPVRMLMVYDKQANGVAPVLGDVLRANATYTSQSNLNNRNRFVILFDRTVQLNASGESGSSRVINVRVNLRNKLVTFNGGTAGTVADISTGSIYIFSVGSVAPGATAGSTDGTARVRFTE